MEKLLGPKGSKLFEKRKDKSLVQQVENLAAAMRDFQTEPGNLKEYSPWLSAFKADQFSNELEIPGISLKKLQLKSGPSVNCKFTDKLCFVHAKIFYFLCRTV